MTEKNDKEKKKPLKKSPVFETQKFRSAHTGWYAQRPLHWQYSGEENKMDDVVTSFMNAYGMGESFREVMFLSEVMQRLGEDFIKHLRPINFRSGVLFCIVDSPVWNHQYSMMKEEILLRLNRDRNGPDIRDIRFKVGNFNDPQYLSIEEEKESKLTSSIQQQSLTEEDRTFLDGCVRELASDLRPVVRETLEVILKYRKLKGLS